MAFDSFADFIAMGKHGVYVWSSYGLTFAIIVGLLWQAWQQRQRFFQEQMQQMKREAQNANQEK
ncbi:heme exporter protein CcmD [Moraxellaceae bacterium AER2_44_116]|nr:heme exporter protein CcmD [Moraxellaceae bacterium]TQC99841.1 heme exporter protein CcmD [Moraxellaceae bacterium AER2_44_116]